MDVMSPDTFRLLGLCISFFVLFCAFFSAQNQISATLGTNGRLSLGLLYGSFAISAVLAPAILRGFKQVARACSALKTDEDLLRAESVGLVVGAMLYVPLLVACAFREQTAAQMIGSVLLGVGAGILWVSEGSLLNASCTESNRGRWSGIFWGSFMTGSAAGNFVTAFLLSGAGGFDVKSSTLFYIFAAVAAVSVLCFAVLVRPRGPSLPAAPASPLLLGNKADAAVDATASIEAGRERGNARVAPEEERTVAAPADESLLRDIRELLALFCKPQLLVLAPLLLFIGCENGFWSGANNGLIGGAWGAEKVALVCGTLAVFDITASVVAGAALDSCAVKCCGWGSRIVLVCGVASFAGGVAITVAVVRPAALAVAAGSDGDLPPLAFVAAALMGVGDGTMNTVTTTRLGQLAEDAHMLPVRTAFQFFQCVNVLMTGVTFALQANFPLEKSFVQIYVLGALAAAAAGFFALFARPVGAITAQTAAVAEEATVDAKAGGAADVAPLPADPMSAAGYAALA